VKYLDKGKREENILKRRKRSNDKCMENINELETASRMS